MRRRVSTLATVAALLTLYLGAPCLALARGEMPMPMDEASAGPCEAGADATDLLCASADPYTTLVETQADPAAPTAELAPAPQHAARQAPASATPRPAAPPEAPPAFLLHRALLI